MAYDAENGLREKSYPDGTLVAFAYDANGNLSSMIDSTGTTTFQQDALERLTETVDCHRARIGYGYDGRSNSTALVYPGGMTLTNYFDAADRLRQIADWHGQAFRYEYDAAGRMLRMAYPNGILHNRSYDAAGWLSAVDYTLDGTNLIRYSWTRDAGGSPLTQAEEGTLPP